MNLSADDDSQILIEMMVPHFQYLQLMNQCLTLYASGDCFDDIIIHNVIWFFGNIIGDKTPDFCCGVIEATDFIAFLNSLVS